jgi:RHS repeat-associated protein
MLGSVRDDVSNTGGLLNHQDFNAWGKLTYQSAAIYADRFGFTGRPLDTNTGLQNNRARWYDPATSRWMSLDPVGFNAGDSNLYRYVQNTPVNAVDPNGEFPVLTLIAVGLIGGALFFGTPPAAQAPGPNDGFVPPPPVDLAGAAVGAPIGAAVAVGAYLSELAILWSLRLAWTSIVTSSAASGGTRLLGRTFGQLGTVVRNPNIRITGATSYAIGRLVERGCTPGMVQFTVQNAIVVLRQSTGRFYFLTTQAAVVLDPTGEIITGYTRADFDANVMQLLRLAGAL